MLPPDIPILLYGESLNPFLQTPTGCTIWMEMYGNGVVIFIDPIIIKTALGDNPQGPAESYDPEEPGTIKHVQRGGSFICSDQYRTRYKAGTVPYAK